VFFAGLQLLVPQFSLRCVGHIPRGVFFAGLQLLAPVLSQFMLFYLLTYFCKSRYIPIN
jgi:hypothetical protein